ncbi:TPA: hypothetical protein ACGUXP_003577 [Vibrio vulnificus]
MHLKSYLVTFMLFVSFGLTFSTHTQIAAEPSRTALIKRDGKHERLYVRKSTVTTDAKVIEFVTDVIAECFSLTAVNAKAKSQYCQEMYFGRNAGIVYKQQFADKKAIVLSSNDASYYTVAAKPPIILATPDVKANRLFYALYVPVMTTTVLRNELPSGVRHMRLWVKPSLNAKNPKMYEIIGVKL